MLLFENIFWGLSVFSHNSHPLDAKNIYHDSFLNDTNRPFHAKSKISSYSPHPKPWPRHPNVPTKLLQSYPSRSSYVSAVALSPQCDTCSRMLPIPPVRDGSRDAGRLSSAPCETPVFSRLVQGKSAALRSCDAVWVDGRRTRRGWGTRGSIGRLGACFWDRCYKARSKSHGNYYAREDQSAPLFSVMWRELTEK